MPQITRSHFDSADSLLSTSLDPLETTMQAAGVPLREHAAPSPDVGVIFRHSGWSRYRDQIASAFASLHLPDTRRTNFACCGEGAWVWQSPDDPTHYKLSGNYCHDRWCLPCGAARGRTIARNAMAYVAGRQLRFLTLTLRQVQAPLREHIDRLTDCFARLRRSRFWRDNVAGGMAILEVKHGAQAGTWNAHYHVLVEGKYLPHAIIKAMWHRITGDSYVVDIRAVGSTDAAAHYITKYVSKPLDRSVFRDEATLREAISAMHGKRTLSTFGAWSGLSLTSEDTDAEWISIGPLAELQRDAHSGDAAAKQILLSLHRETYAPRGDDP